MCDGVGEIQSRVEARLQESQQETDSTIAPEPLPSMARPRPLLSSAGVLVTPGGLEFSCRGARFLLPALHPLIPSSSPESC